MMTLTEQCLSSISRVSELQLEAATESNKVLQEVYDKYESMKSINPDIVMEDAPWYIKTSNEGIIKTILLAIPRLLFGIFQMVKKYWDKLVDASKNDTQKAYERVATENLDVLINESLKNPNVHVELLDKKNSQIRIYYNTKLVSFEKLNEFILYAEAIMLRMFEDGFLAENILNENTNYTEMIAAYGHLGTTYLDSVLLSDPREVSLDELVGRDASIDINAPKNFTPELSAARDKLDTILKKLTEYIDKVSKIDTWNGTRRFDPSTLSQRREQIVQEANKMREVYTSTFAKITKELDSLVTAQNDLWRVFQNLIKLKNDLLEKEPAEENVMISDLVNGPKKINPVQVLMNN